MFDEMFHEALDMLMKEIRTSKHNYRTQMVEKTGLRCRITVSDVKVELQLYTRDYGMIFNLQYDKKTENTGDWMNVRSHSKSIWTRS